MKTPPSAAPCPGLGSLPRADILGVRLSLVNLGLAVRQIAAWIEEGSRHYVNICTVHTVMECHKDPMLRKIVNTSGMATPDGVPLVWFARKHGHRNISRVCGPDLLPAFCEYSVARGYRHFFYGGTSGVPEEMASRLVKRFPGLVVAGCHSPRTLSIGQMEGRGVIEKINAALPDVVWVGLGTPKQDYWVANHRGALDAPVLVAIGAAFDFHAGIRPRAPEWMQRFGLEWFYRLLQEPGRLWKRYLFTNTAFLYLVIRELARNKRKKPQGGCRA